MDIKEKNTNFWLGKKHSEESKLKMSLARIGKKSLLIGRKLSEETRQKISNTLKGKFVGDKNPNFGNKHTEEARRKIRLARSRQTIKKGRIVSDETKIKLRNARLGKKLEEKTKELIREKALRGAKSPTWKGGKIKKFCEICNKEFYVYKKVIERGNGKFCGMRCRNIYINQRMKTKNTSIEIAIENELIKNNIPFMKQVPVLGITLADFVLPNNIIIQCDGDYWHSLPKTIKRDTEQDIQLIKNNYLIFRFRESEIRKSAAECVKKIINHVECVSNI